MEREREREREKERERERDSEGGREGGREREREEEVQVFERREFCYGLAKVLMFQGASLEYPKALYRALSWRAYLSSAMRLRERSRNASSGAVRESFDGILSNRLQSRMQLCSHGIWKASFGGRFRPCRERRQAQRQRQRQRQRQTDRQRKKEEHREGVCQRTTSA